MSKEKEDIKYNPSGKIKARFFALILLALSCSLAITAFKSLGRNFDGLVVYKAVHTGFIQKNYDLYISQDYSSNSQQKLSNSEAIQLMVENFEDYTKVGVSYFAFQEAMISSRVTKKRGSPIVIVDGSYFIDQGLFWIFLSLLGSATAVTIYRQTSVPLKSADKNKSEDLDL